MRALLKDGLLVLVPEEAGEEAELARWKGAHADHVFAAAANEGTGLELHSLGPRADACREPINVVSNSPDPAIRPIGNFAPTPFELDGAHYASVESFWQGLKFPEGKERRRIAALNGAHARAEGEKQGYAATVRYGESDITVGTWEHWQLMERACRAKFAQNEEARAALLATGNRPLVHIVRRDSRSIPGVIMAEIWMRIRTDLRRDAG
ncbi:MAG TPA: NADAR family protein [Hyphomicrobiaceae bacterium]|nr:NADAR family protein [Hyphomicrobiaceae bacterium]